MEKIERRELGFSAVLLAGLLAGLPAPAADFQTLYRFQGGLNGSTPATALAVDAAGNLYGTTSLGGIEQGPDEYGVVFEVSKPPAKARLWSEQTIFDFSTKDSGWGPRGPVLLDGSGGLYGTDQNGGPQDYGAVFHLTPPAQPGGQWAEQTVEDLDGKDGLPVGNLVMAVDGSLVYASVLGGQHAWGGLYLLSPPGNGGSDWTLSTLYSFEGGSAGYELESGPLLRRSGRVFGATYEGGGAFKGLAYRLVPPGAGETAWRERPIYSFEGGTDGAYPEAQLIADPHGNLYGTTTQGGSTACGDKPGCGTVLMLSPPHDTGAAAWTETVLYRFQGGKHDGARPIAGLFRDRSGALYGTAESGGTGPCFGTKGCGVVFKLKPPAEGQTVWTETLLHVFSGYGDGAEPGAPLVPGPGNWLYGTSKGRITDRGAPHTYGTVFRIQP